MAYLGDKKMLFAPSVVVHGGSPNAKLIEKTITENGYYVASDEGADGYSSVSVLIPKGEDIINGIVSRQIDYLSLPTATFIGQWALAHCSKLETVDAPELTGINIGGFYSCSSLKNVNFPKLENIANGTMANAVFSNCSALEKIELPSVNLIGNYAFLRATSLEKVVIGKPAQIGINAFGNCSALKTFVIDTANGIPTLASTNAFTGTPIANGTGYIYTDDPDALKAADVWYNFADKIKSKNELPTE